MNTNHAKQTIGEYLKLATQIFYQNHIPSPALDAEILLSFVLKKPKEFLYTYPEKKLSPIQIAKLKKLIQRRAKYEPIAYLTNSKEFYSRNFYVDKRVLIPRPETELLIEEALANIEGDKTIKNIIDVGTGSGCIGITLKLEQPRLNIIATDISKPALQVAQKNARHLRAKIKFIYGNLLASINDKNINTIIANLPYVPIEKKTNLHLPQEKSIKYEPQKALYAKNNGLDLYEKLFKQIARLKLTPKIIICEIGPGQATQIKTLAKKYLPSTKTTIKKDLAGKTRLAIVK